MTLLLGEGSYLCPMSSTLTIGDFSRATHLTIKTLRNYHESGLLEPAVIDERTGYRRYNVEQIQVAQIIRRFRDLDMPLNEIRAVISASNVEQRNELVASHLRRLESDLAQTQAAVLSLRDLLENPTPAIDVKRRKIESVNAASITEMVKAEDAWTWLTGALGELHAVVTAQRMVVTGHAGGIYAGALFNEAHGEATVFIPCQGKIRPIGRVVSVIVPGVELATVIHKGPHIDSDRAYGFLADYVTRHELAVEGPLREYYLVSPQDTLEANEWRTEIGWPIFQMR